MMPKELFLSHSDKDRKFASAIVRALARNGVPVWYSRRSIVGAQQWHDEIGAALKRCDWFAVILSPNSVSSTWVKRELLFALSNNRYRDKIIPILYHDCDVDSLSWTLSNSQMVDFRDGFTSGARALMRVWGMGYKSR
jgi:hypothetical protein